VPRNLIGVIIGKSGDMIKKIQEDSGCRVQFKPEDEDMGGPTRICTISGSSQGNQMARNVILELIDSGMVSSIKEGCFCEIGGLTCLLV
jgi:far upstream element-binding protein